MYIIIMFVILYSSRISLILPPLSIFPLPFSFLSLFPLLLLHVLLFSYPG